MSRLRVRVELNRRKAGVPMEELVSVVDETRKFFHLLAEDVQIEGGRGEWLASNFDPEALNFTAEYDGPASVEQVKAFGSAFGGTTSLRRETIAQFTRIADFIGEDELVGFGLYQSDQETEPSDWRCLSRRDAVRFSDEIRMLAQATGTSESVAPLPVAKGVVAGRRLFKDRRERDTLAADPSRSMRELEASLSSRMSQLESKVEAHTHHIQDLGKSRDVAEERFMKLIGAMETFWSQAPRQLAAPTALALAPAPEANTGSGLPTMDAMAAERPPRASRWWKFGLAVGGAALVLAAAKYPEIARQLSTSSQAAAPVQAASVLPVSAPGPISTPAPVEETPAAVENPAIVTPAPPSPAVKRATETEAPRNTRDSARAGMIHQVSLEVPAEFRSEIDSPVTVDVNVSIDPQGKVTNAAVSSTKGTGAELLTPQALKAARWFRFQPTRKGNKAIASEMILSFVFEPEAITPVAEER